MERLKITLSLLVMGLTFAADHQCVGDTRSDLEAIRELFLTLERGYEEHDLEKYMSVFSDEKYEYMSDMATPDDPTDDVHYVGVERERRSAERVFDTYEILNAFDARIFQALPGPCFQAAKVIHNGINHIMHDNHFLNV